MLTHIRKEELRAFITAWIQNENDYRLPDQSFTGSEVAFMVLVLIDSEGTDDSIADFLNQIIDIQTYE